MCSDYNLTPEGHAIALATRIGAQSARQGFGVPNPFPIGTLEAHVWEQARFAAMGLGGAIPFGFYAELESMEVQ